MTGTGNENKVKFNITLIFLITLIGISGVVLYLSGLKDRIGDQKRIIENQYAALTLANTLISDINDAQEQFYLYIGNFDSAVLLQYEQKMAGIGKIISRIIRIKPQEKTRLLRLDSLVHLRSKNIESLKRLLDKQEEKIDFSQFIKRYEEEVSKADTITIKGKADTITSRLPNKKFFRRLAELFAPRRDSITIISENEDYTIKRAKDTLRVVYDISDTAEEAIFKYENRLDSIHRQVIDFTVAERRISSDISSLVSGFHSRIIREVVSHIKTNEQNIRKSYIFSIVVGSTATLIILLFLLLTTRDIHKDKKYREQIEAANLRIRNTMESRHKLLLAITHDIKSPLNSILGYLELLEKDGINVRSMQNSGRHILTMLQNLLEYSTLEQGKRQISLTRFNIRDLCRETYEMFLPLCEKKGIVLDYRASDLSIESDLTKIRQIAVNLVSNSVKYTTKGSIAISMLYKEGFLNIAVSDTGAGIPEEKLEMLFLPFERIEQNNRLAEGTGLGMFVVKGLIDQMEGSIDIRSKVGKGTGISVRIPAKTASETLEHRSLRIRIFDDDPIIETYVSQMLLSLGHRIVDRDPDIILTDMEMGNRNGMDILAESGNIPVVIMTGRIDFTTETARQLGFKAFLQKPFNLEALKNVFGDATQKSDSAEKKESPMDELIGDNKEEIKALFRKNTKENFQRLQKALEENDFNMARAICHRMLPTFIIMGLPSEDLKTMDQHKDAPFTEWENCIRRILQISIP